MNQTFRRSKPSGANGWPHWQKASWIHVLNFEMDAKLVTKDAARDFAQGETHFGGYMIVNAASLDQAVRIAQGSPHARLGGRIVVRAVVSF